MKKQKPTLIDYLLTPYYLVAVIIDEIRASRRQRRRKGYDRWEI